MKKSVQDSYYLEKEGDSFFSRNYKNKDLPVLRKNKEIILNNIIKSNISYQSVIEYGCCYGDLLSTLKNDFGKEVFGVEASAEAVEFALERYNHSIEVTHGTVADNVLRKDSNSLRTFDLAIIDDVFGWISRETIFTSVSSIDSSIRDGGFLYIRDFFPDKRTKNRNHHVVDSDIYNYKVPGSHASMFLASGVYEVVWQEIYYDKIGMSTGYKCDNDFNYRWTDVILQKSTNSFFSESKKV